jgi:hypothetical protein
MERDLELVVAAAEANEVQTARHGGSLREL